MPKTLKQIAEKINGNIIGDENTVIAGISGIKEARKGDITFVDNPKYKPLIDKTQASAIITSKDISSAPVPIVQVENPSLAFSEVISMFMPDKEQIHPKGIDGHAVISNKAKLGKDISVGANTVIEEEAEIEDGVIIYPNCYIGKGAKTGRGSLIYPNVTVRENSIIGKNVIIHSGTVIGSDGFGYIKVKDRYHKIPQTGIVVIEDDVEIGANVAIDRARFGKTVIGAGTKIDNMVQIAHNVQIGPNSIIVAQTGISGSVTIGKNAVLAGQVGIVGHVEIGDDVIIGAQAGISKSVPSGSCVLGSPARPINEQKRIFASIKRLPELFKAVGEIKKKLGL